MVIVMISIVVLLIIDLYLRLMLFCFSLFFFFNDTATTEIYTLSLHDALPISERFGAEFVTDDVTKVDFSEQPLRVWVGDRKSTRLNSSHTVISYAVFCLKKKKKKIQRAC